MSRIAEEKRLANEMEADRLRNRGGVEEEEREEKEKELDKKKWEEAKRQYEEDALK